jgi:hypothetical protein
MLMTLIIGNHGVLALVGLSYVHYFSFYCPVKYV